MSIYITKSMSTPESRDQAVVRIHVRGRITLDCEMTVGQVAEEIEACADGFVGAIIVDLAEAPTIDAAGLGMLASEFSICQAAGVRLVVENPSRFVEEALQISRLDQFLLPSGPDPLAQVAPTPAQGSPNSGGVVCARSGVKRMTDDEYANEFQTGLKSTARRLMKRGLMKQDAEELAQAAWVKGYRRLNQLQDREAVQWWVNQIASNSIRDEFATRNKLEQLGPEHDRRIEPDLDVRIIDLMRALESLGSQQAHVLRRFYIDGCSITEVAAELAISKTAATSRLARARNALREKLTPRTRTDASYDVAA
jgi:RNA polymerase sigma factor (sigma-70 family)/anti-anti-sigma factor